MSEFVNALTAKIQSEIAAKPSSVRGTIVEVDMNTKTCMVRYPNPTGRGEVVTQAYLPKAANGISGIEPRVGQRVTLNLPQGTLVLPSITELRYIDDDPGSPQEEEERKVNRTPTTPIKVQSTAKPSGGTQNFSSYIQRVEGLTFPK